jgi:hypothetical protein
MSLAGHSAVVAGFRVVFVGGEIELVAGSVVPRLAEGEVTHLREHSAAGIGHHSVRQIILMVIVGARGINFRQERSVCINVLRGGRAGSGTVLVFGDHFVAGEDVHASRRSLTAIVIVKSLFKATATLVKSSCSGRRCRI